MLLMQAAFNEAIAGHLFQVAQRVAIALRQSGIRCDGVNLLLADGEAAVQEIFHVHLHVIPRYQGDKFGFIAVTKAIRTKQNTETLTSQPFFSAFCPLPFAIPLALSTQIFPLD